jgi:hypothetical protein
MLVTVAEMAEMAARLLVQVHLALVVVVLEATQAMVAMEALKVQITDLRRQQILVAVVAALEVLQARLVLVAVA